MSLYEDFKNYLSRSFAEGQPDTWIDGGGSLGKTFFDPENRNPEALRTYEDIYKSGGPISQMIDARAYMIFGVGGKWTAERPEVEEWLESNFGHVDELFPRIARDVYVYGESDTETVETRAGGFSHEELINPKTLEPQFDDTGKIIAWTQTIRSNGTEKQQTFSAQSISHFTLSKVGRQVGGVSLIGRALDEVERYAQNQENRARFLNRYGNPKRQFKVGREGGPSVDDNQLRKLRSRVRNIEQDQDFFTGSDVDVEQIDDFGSASIMDATEIDLKQLAIALGIPLELADIGGDGMGTGRPADLRLAAFIRQGKSEQQMFIRQFINQTVEPAINRFSPFNSQEIQIGFEFDEIITDKSDTASWMSTAKDVLTVDEIRQEFGYAPHDGDESELGPPEDSQADQGIFGMSRAMSPLEGGDEVYNSEAEASERAEEIGCSGTHTMEQGGETLYMPCGTHEEFVENQPEQVQLSEANQEASKALEVLMDSYERVAWDEADDRELFAFDDEDVPEFAKNWLRQAVQTGAVFSQFDTIEQGTKLDLQQSLLDSLETEHGWSINSLTENVMDATGASKRDAERIARTETQSIVANAREIGYEERDMLDENYRWVGPGDNRTTDRCEWIRENSQDGVSLDRLKELVQKSVEEFPEEGPGGREWTPHINCRHTFVRARNVRNNSRALKDIEDIDTGDYPEAAVENAQMALDAREETGNPNDCGTQVGWERANQLVNGEELSEDTIGRMAAFARHEQNKEQGEEGRSDCGWMMWKAWGGDEGIEWAQSLTESETWLTLTHSPEPSLALGIS